MNELNSNRNILNFKNNNDSILKVFGASKSNSNILNFEHKENHNDNITLNQDQSERNPSCIELDFMLANEIIADDLNSENKNNYNDSNLKVLDSSYTNSNNLNLNINDIHDDDFILANEIIADDQMINKRNVDEFQQENDANEQIEKNYTGSNLIYLK